MCIGSTEILGFLVGFFMVMIVTAAWRALRDINSYRNIK